MRRDKKIVFRVTDEELQVIQKAAAKDERVLSDFCRLTLLRAIRKGKPKRR